MKKKVATFAVLFFLLGCTPNESKFQSKVPVNTPPSQEVSESLSKPNLPSSFNLDVQFYPQAPKADWGMPYQEACEEASLILAYNYVTFQTMTVDEFDKAIRDMVDWQIETYGSHKDITIEEVAMITEKYLGFSNFEIVDNPTVEQMKEFLVQGYPIVAPFAGRQLGNPFFTEPGPIYHMLVIKGYEETEKGLRFITDDVGTKRGKNFTYDAATLMAALHDWVDGSLEDETLMNLGAKRILVLKGR